MLSGWLYRKSITLARASGAVTNHQMKLLVGESSGSTGESVDCGGHCLSNFNDLRFTNYDGDLLSYWIESISGTTPNQLATIWIKFDSIGTSDTTFYMYYGNASAESVSSGANTFLWFNDSNENDGDYVSGDIALRAKVSIASGTDYNGIGLKNSGVGYSNIFYVSSGNKWLNTQTNTEWWQWGDASKIVADTTKIYDLARVVGVGTYGWVDGEYAGAGEATGYIPTGSLKSWTSAANTTDWRLIRQYYATDPEWGSWGAEEEFQEESVFLATSQNWQQVADMKISVGGLLNNVHEGWVVVDGNWKPFWPPT